MIRLQGRMLLLSGAVTGMLLLQACGQNAATNGNGESFAAVAEAPQSTEEVAKEAQISSSPSPQATAPVAKDGVAASAAPSKGTDAGPKVTVTFKPSPAPTAAPVGTATRKPSGKTVTTTPSPAASSSVHSPRPVASPKDTGEQRCSGIRQGWICSGIKRVTVTVSVCGTSGSRYRGCCLHGE